MDRPGGGVHAVCTHDQLDSLISQALCERGCGRTFVSAVRVYGTGEGAYDDEAVQHLHRADVSAVCESASGAALLGRGRRAAVEERSLADRERGGNAAERGVRRCEHAGRSDAGDEGDGGRAQVRVQSAGCGGAAHGGGAFQNV
ncbi:glutaredoxin-3 [Gracilaria domingensis]|nr:glutaredoxin-3 [Gracilaria domingensis]